MRLRRDGLIALGVVLWMGAPLASAQSLLQTLEVCAGKADSTQRLECYDREVRGALSRAADANAAPAVATAPAAAVTTPDQAFGLDSVRARERDASARAEPAKPPKLEAHVASLAQQSSGKFVFTLDNGQVWRQTENTPMLIDFKAGETVTITPGALGSYWMVGDSRRPLRVKRSK